MLGSVFLGDRRSSVEAATTPAPAEKLLNAIRDYHTSLSVNPTQPPLSIPQETAEAYKAKIRELFAQEAFKELEKIAEVNRSDPGYLVGGVWRRWAFYDALAYPPPGQSPKSLDHQRLIERTNKWKAAFPESSAARITLGLQYVVYADFVRGMGSPDSLDDLQRAIFDQRIAFAERALLDAAALSEHDPEWYIVMIYLAYDAGWDQPIIRELLDQGLSVEPNNYHYYRGYSMYLATMSHGHFGEVLPLAEEALAKHPGPTGPILYFVVMSALAAPGTYLDAELRKGDWQLMKSGYSNLTRIYGVYDPGANRFAAMAVVFKDKPAAREAFTHVSQWDPLTWPDEDTFRNGRAWAEEGTK